MSNSLLDRIDETRERWVKELDACRNELLELTLSTRDRRVRLVVELDYLLVEAKIALETKQESEFCPACDAGVGHCNGPHKGSDEIPF